MSVVEAGWVARGSPARRTLLDLEPGRLTRVGGRSVRDEECWDRRTSLALKGAYRVC